jgi:hypothetical protein
MGRYSNSSESGKSHFRALVRQLSDPEFLEILSSILIENQYLVAS